MHFPKLAALAGNERERERNVEEGGLGAGVVFDSVRELADSWHTHYARAGPPDAAVKT